MIRAYTEVPEGDIEAWAIVTTPLDEKINKQCMSGTR